MSYAVFADVQSEFKNIKFTSTTKVTDTEVTGFLAQAEQEINATIGTKYALPIPLAATNSLLFLKSIEISIVADRVSKILEVKSSSQKVDQDDKSGRATIWGREMLRKIQDGRVILLDDASDQLITATTADGVSSFNTDDAAFEHEFQRGVDDW